MSSQKSEKEEFNNSATWTIDWRKLRDKQTGIVSKRTVRKRGDGKKSY